MHSFFIKLILKKLIQFIFNYNSVQSQLVFLIPRQEFKRKMSFACSAIYLHPKLKPIVEKCGENSIYNNNIFNL